MAITFLDEILDKRKISLTTDGKAVATIGRVFSATSLLRMRETLGEVSGHQPSLTLGRAKAGV
jgi:hypothetical protein